MMWVIRQTAAMITIVVDCRNRTSAAQFALWRASNRLPTPNPVAVLTFPSLGRLGLWRFSPQFALFFGIV